MVGYNPEGLTQNPHQIMNKRELDIIGSSGTSTTNAGTWTFSNHVPYNNFNINNIPDNILYNNILSSNSSSFLANTVDTSNRVVGMVAGEEMVGVVPHHIPATVSNSSPITN